MKLVFLRQLALPDTQASLTVHWQQCSQQGKVSTAKIIHYNCYYLIPNQHKVLSCQWSKCLLVATGLIRSNSRKVDQLNNKITWPWCPAMATPDGEISAVRFFTVCCGWMIHPIAKVCEEVNRKCPARNTTVQLSTPYTDPEHHNIFCHRQTDDSIMPIADLTACSSTISRSWLGVCTCDNCQFLACDSIYAIARYMLSPVRPSVCLSVRPSHGWISQRQLKLGSRNLHHSPMTLVSWRLTSPCYSKGKIGSGGAK